MGTRRRFGSMDALKDTAFSVDIAGLLEALTQQFPEPLLCVRELVQNAADAGALHIEVEASFDPNRGLLRLAVRDDGRGMGSAEIEGYLTIGFSEKRPDQHRGRFGIGKLSPYALGIERMTVRTSNGQQAHRLTFDRHGYGKVAAEAHPGPRGTEVRVYKRTDRAEAETLARRTYDLVKEHCDKLPVELRVNGTRISAANTSPGRYGCSFEFSGGWGTLQISAEPSFRLLSGGILLESRSPILGDLVGYELDCSELAPTLSRNAVRRDGAFEALVRTARAELPRLTEIAVDSLEARVRRLRQHDLAVERALDADDRAAVDWLRARVMEPDLELDPRLRRAPVFETADGGLVSVEEVRKNVPVPVSRVPRTREELFGYVDRGVPVLLLYRDVEDFLSRQGIDTVEVDDLDMGSEVDRASYSAGEAALVRSFSRDPQASSPRARSGGSGVWFAAAGLTGVLALGALTWAVGWTSDELVAARMSEGGPAPDRSELLFVDRTVAASRRSSEGSPPPAAGTPWARELRLGGAVLCLALAWGLSWRFLRTGSTAGRAGRTDPSRPLVRRPKRRLNVWWQAMRHPKDYLVARFWSRDESARTPPITPDGYRELSPEQHEVCADVRLDLDALAVGFVDLRSAEGAEHEGRQLVLRGGKVLLNRNHPTVRDLIRLAERDRTRSRMLLECLLSTDPVLAKGIDPRQMEWELLSRCRSWVARSRS